MKIAGCVLIVLTLFSVPALAENNDITLFGGVQLPGKITLNNAASTGATGVSQIITDPGNFGVFGLRIGHGNVFGGEYTLAYASNFLDTQSKAVFYNSNLRVQLPFPIVKPYGTAGLGALTTWGNSISDIGTKFAFNYGGGVRIMPGGPVGIRADVRGYVIPSVQSQTLNVGEVSLGVVFGF